MKIKHLLAVMSLLLMAMIPQHAMANDPDDYLYLSPDEIQLNKDGVGTVVVWLNTNVTEYNAFIMNLYLPEGFTVEKNSRGKYNFVWNTEEEVVVNHGFTVGEHDGYLRLVAASMSADCILPGDHWLFKFNIQAPEGYTGDGEVAFRGIEFAEGTIRNHYFDDVEAPIRPYGYTTGLDEVIGNVEDGTEVIYNLQGIRVARPLAPGIYIINGAKTLVK